MHTYMRRRIRVKDRRPDTQFRLTRVLAFVNPHRRFFFFGTGRAAHRPRIASVFWKVTDAGHRLMRCRNSRFYTRGTSRRKTQAFILFKSHAFVYPRGYVLREDRVARFGLARALRSRRERLLLAQRYFSAGIAKIHLRGYSRTKNCNSRDDYMGVKRVNFDKLPSRFSSRNSIGSFEKAREKYRLERY